ncbi:hypothetical protein FRB95_003179 [Tulasnella sp. JGI-2019a]|nr:hypothetical protein FRB95_003179 [Tulasnella sp. JGI-2019a]
MDTLRSSSYNAAIAFLTTDALVWSADKWTKGDCIQLRGIRDARSHWPPVDSHTPPTVTDVEQPPRKMQIMVCIKSSIGQGSYNKAADNDIQLWFRAGADCVDIEVPQDVRATVWKIYPTQRQVERVIRFVTSNLREMDECTLAVSVGIVMCLVSTHPKKVKSSLNAHLSVALRLADRSEVTGRQLNMWLTEHTHPATLIRVGLDVSLIKRALLVGRPAYAASNNA